MNAKPYNQDISYEPKDACIRKAAVRTLPYKKPTEIPFYDSRYDVFYGHDPAYTTHMLIEDEMSGLWAMKPMELSLKLSLSSPNLIE